MNLNKSFISICLISLIANVKSISFEDDTNLNSTQKELLNKFRVLVEGKLPHENPYMKKDTYLIKWLRTSDFDLKDAEKRLLDTLEWRVKERMESIHQEDWKDMQKDFKYYLQGRDKYGRSILYFDVGSLDVRRAIIEGKSERFSRYGDKAIDEACTLVRTLGERYGNITRGHLIVNLDGYNLVQHGCFLCIPLILGIVISFNEHYPECADQLITVNTPSIVKPLLDLIRPLLGEELRKSLKIYGTNKKEWMEKMSKDFDFSKLPPAIGGTQVYDGMEDL